VRNNRVALVALLAGAAHAVGAEAESPRFEVGLRGSIVTAGGEPTNDMIAFGVFGRYRIDERWRLGFGIESFGGDFERPYELVGLASPEELDSDLSTLLVTVWIDRLYGARERRMRWFWSAGLGVASPDADELTGPVTGGGMFDVTADPGTELVIGVSGGLRWRLGQRFGLELGLRVDQHFADWTVTDRVSGQTGTVDDYTAKGAYLGAAWRF
jgi:Outer membrane protein beta-barrel domain